jgi:predicted protein tyrosine phosphatase
MKLLFVCTANIDRSPTGEDIFKDQLGFEVKSAGTEEGYATVPISKELIEWADVIFCMENHHRSKVIKKNSKTASKTVVLDIPDIYYRGSPELVKLLKAKVSKYFQQEFGLHGLQSLNGFIGD